MALSETSLLIRWDLPELLEQNGPVNGYEIVLTYSNGTSSIYNSPFEDVFNLQIEGNCFLVLKCLLRVHALSSGLPKFVNVSITVAARTPAGVGPVSVPIIVNRARNDGKSPY
jgi:hypothetical protein